MTDDTQPRSPFQRPLDDQQPMLTPPPDDESPRGPGCLLWGLVGGAALAFALAIVLLAGAAGWTEGQRIADRHATATQAGLIGEQLVRIPTDVAQGNPINLNRRLDYLETVAPGNNTLPGLRQTATALYLTSQPTLTPTPSATPTATVTPAATDAAPEVTAQVRTEGGFDLDLVALLQEARDEIAAGDFAEAQDTLDIIIRADSQFQQETVEGLMYEVLTTQARRLYATENTLAEAIRLTDLAEEYGPIAQSPLSYERLIAGLYLDAQRAVGSSDHATAIQRIRNILQYQTSYLGQDLNRLLFDEYVAYAQAWEFGEQYCQAVQQYNNALALFNSAEVNARLENAQNLCLQGTPLPGTEGTPTIAPVGQQ